MSATTEAIGQLRASYEKLDREAKSKQVEMERFTNEALARHKAETGEIAPAPGSELFEQLKSARAVYATVRQWAEYLSEMEERRARYAPVGDYEGGAMAASEEISDLLEGEGLIQPEDRPKLLVLLPDLVPLDKYQELLSQCV
jgi:hypothetical protein